MQSSVKEIRTRLLVLLGRAFIVMLMFILFVFISVVGYFLSSTQSPFQIESLQGYYLGHGSWDGVEKIFELDSNFNGEKIILLDEEQRVILDRVHDSNLVIGTRYEIQPDDITNDITIRGKKVGTYVIHGVSFFDKLKVIIGILLPTGIVLFFLAIFASLVAILLMRRFVNPLADVIYAAGEVATGKLNTRIRSKGPQDLQSLSESFNEMASSLEQNDRERREMLADVAHELRTPLSVIRGRLEGIVDGIYSENGSQVSMALEQTYIMQRLVDDLRLLTLAETRQLTFDKHDLNVENVINSVIEIFSAEVEEKNISLSFIEQSGNLSAPLDSQRFEQIISNLVGNAIRYVPDGGSVWVTANETGDSLRITVNDNGKGVPVEDLPFIFDRFWRKEKSRARATGGTGLGLAIAKQLVEAQGGTIEAKNLKEGGLQVMIELKK